MRVHSYGITFILEQNNIWEVRLHNALLLEVWSRNERGRKILP